jgi:uncharacterized membrane protein
MPRPAQAIDATQALNRSAGSALLVVGSVAFFLGLTVVIPVLGHATWHLYRKAVEPDPNPHAAYQPTR